MYRSSTRDYAGAVVIIHTSEDYPETDIVTTNIQPDQETNIAVSATAIESIEEIRNLFPSERKCIFKDEVR